MMKCHLNHFSKTTGIISLNDQVLEYKFLGHYTTGITVQSANTVNQKTSISESSFTYFLRSNIHKMSSSLIWARVSVVKLQLIVDLIRCSIPKAFTEQAHKNPVNTMFPINSSSLQFKKCLEWHFRKLYSK